MNDQHPFALGTQVRVSNGEARPPERFNRKLREWKCQNFDGVVVEFNPEYGGYSVQKKPENGWRPNDFILITCSGIAPSRVKPIPGACLAPLKGDGMSRTVDAIALLRLEANAA